MEVARLRRLRPAYARMVVKASGTNSDNFGGLCRYERNMVSWEGLPPDELDDLNLASICVQPLRHDRRV